MKFTRNYGKFAKIVQHFLEDRGKVDGILNKNCFKKFVDFFVFQIFWETS